MANFWKPEACGQTVLPDRSILIGQKIGGNWKMPKVKNSNATVWVFFKQCDLLQYNEFFPSSSTPQFFRNKSRKWPRQSLGMQN